MIRLSRRGRTRGAGKDRQSGQALLEFALVVPILILFVMAIFQFAYVLESQNGLTNAVREAARRAAATSSTNPTWANLRTWTLREMNGDGTPANKGLLKTNVSGYDANRLWPATPAVTFCSYVVSGVTQYRIQIDVKYKHPVFFGPIGFATDMVDGTPNGTWDLSASAQMRLESVDAVAAAANNPGACT